MKHDIRDLFKEELIIKNKLPDTHEQEFNNKLKRFNAQKRKSSNYNNMYLMVASLLLFLAFGYYMLNEKGGDQNKFVEQIEIIEKEYLLNINTEWNNFITIAKDEKLVARYKDRLEYLNKDYEVISNQFKLDTNNILFLEALIENLQTRLKLLKDIQEHITLLNQENKYYEKTTI